MDPRKGNKSRLRLSARRKRRRNNLCEYNLRRSRLQKTEKFLTTWIKEQHEENLPLSPGLIMTNPTNTYENLNETENADTRDSYSYKASTYWNDKFQKRSNPHFLHTTDKKVNADEIPEDVQVQIEKENTNMTPIEFSEVYVSESRNLSPTSCKEQNNFSQLCNLCFVANYNLRILSSPAEINLFKNSIRLCLPEIEFPERISLRLCASCYSYLQILCIFQKLCTVNSPNLKELCQVRENSEFKNVQNFTNNVILQATDTTDTQATGNICREGAMSKDIESTRQIKLEVEDVFQDTIEHELNIEQNFVNIKNEFQTECIYSYINDNCTVSGEDLQQNKKIEINSIKNKLQNYKDQSEKNLHTHQSVKKYSYNINERIDIYECQSQLHNDFAMQSPYIQNKNIYNLEKESKEQYCGSLKASTADKEIYAVRRSNTT